MSTLSSSIYMVSPASISRRDLHQTSLLGPSFVTQFQRKKTWQYAPYFPSGDRSVDDEKPKTLRPKLRLMSPTRNSILARVVLNSLVCSRINTQQLQIVRCLGPHNNLKEMFGQRLRLHSLQHQRPQVRDKHQRQTNSVLRMDLSRCDGASTTLKPHLHRILNQPSRQDIHFPRVLLSTSLDLRTLLPKLPPASRHLGYGRGTDQRYQALGHPTVIRRPASCGADLQAIVQYRMDHIQHSQQTQMQSLLQA